MTVAATEELVSGPYNGNGVTTQFDYGFRVYADTEVKVVRENADGTFTTLTLTTDYTVAGVNAVTGRQITLVSGDRLPTGAKLTIEPDITLSQERPFGSQSSTDLSQMERSYDKLTSMVRQVFGLIQRVPVAAAGSVIGTIKVGTDGQTLAWDANGNVVPGPTTASIDQAAVDAQTAATKATEAATSASNANDAADDAEAAQTAAELARDQAQGAIDAVPTGTELVGQESKFLTVNAAETGYELVSSTAGFYGLKKQSDSLILDKGDGNFDAGDYIWSGVHPAGLTFSINAAGHLVVSA